MSWLSSLKSVFTRTRSERRGNPNRTPKLFIARFKRCFKERISQLQVQGRVLQLTINTFPDEKNTCSKFMMI